LIGGGRGENAYVASELLLCAKQRPYYRDGGDVGPGLGAARLAWLGEQHGTRK